MSRLRLSLGALVTVHRFDKVNIYIVGCVYIH